MKNDIIPRCFFLHYQFEDCFPRKLSTDSDIFARNQLILEQKRRQEEIMALEKIQTAYQDSTNTSQRQIVDSQLAENRKALDVIAEELAKYEVQ